MKEWVDYTSINTSVVVFQGDTMASEEISYVADLIKRNWRLQRPDAMSISKSIATEKSQWGIISKTGLRLYFYDIGTSYVSIRIDATDRSVQKTIFEEVKRILKENSKLSNCRLGYTELTWADQTPNTIDVLLKPRKSNNSPSRSPPKLPNYNTGTNGGFCYYCHTVIPSYSSTAKCPVCGHAVAPINYMLFITCKSCGFEHFIIDCGKFDLPYGFVCNKCGRSNGRSDARTVKPSASFSMETINSKKGTFKHELIGDMVSTLGLLESEPNLDKKCLEKIYASALDGNIQPIPSDCDKRYSERYEFYRELVRALVHHHFGLNYSALPPNTTKRPTGRIIKDYKELYNLQYGGVTFHEVKILH